MQRVGPEARCASPRLAKSESLGWASARECHLRAVTNCKRSGVLSIEMKRALGVATTLASMALLAGGCGSSSHVISLPGLTAAKLARLKAIARQDAKANGDAHPSSVMVFASRRHEANIAAGAGTGVFGSQPVYLVVIRGYFVCSACSRPPGASGAPPQGDVITMVLDRQTLQGLDGGIGGRVDTSNVGSGLPLALG